MNPGKRRRIRARNRAARRLGRARVRTWPRMDDCPHSAGRCAYARDPVELDDCSGGAGCGCIHVIHYPSALTAQDVAWFGEEG